jgi:putative ABC transport system substrate-binding protein
MKRREFITLLGGAAAAWPLAASAQRSVIPVIGFLDPRSPEGVADRLRGFRQGLKETGHIEGETVTTEYRWAENQVNRLPELAADLVRRQPAVIIASGGLDPALAAKAATTTIPVLFLTAEDPVRLGLVASLARPGANLTGVNFLNAELATKRLELLLELVPGAKRIAVLVNPVDATNAKSTLSAIEPAARTIGLQIQVLTASTSREIDAAFAIIGRDRPDAVYVGQTPFLNVRRVQLAQLAARYMVPASYSGREFSEVGGLMSYGSDIADAYRQVGIYAGRILKGAKPADLPVVQANKFELIINAQTARMLGLDLSAQLLARADEVIE